VEALCAENTTVGLTILYHEGVNTQPCSSGADLAGLVTASVQREH
jgi:hypothetical protein